MVGRNNFMKPTGVIQTAATGGNKVKIRPVQDSLPWHKRALSTTSSFVNPKQRNLLQSLGSFSWGQLLGGAVAGAGLLDAAFNVLFKKDDSSFFRKYIFPLVTFVLGSIGIKASSPPKDSYIANMLRTGVTDFIKRAQQFLKGKNIFQAAKELFSKTNDEKRGNLIKAANWTLESAWPALLRSLPGDYTDDPFISELRSIEPEDANIETIKRIISEHGEDAFYNFIKSNPTLLKEVLKELASEKSFRENLNDLVSGLNEIIGPSGLAFDVSYNTEENLINVCLRSTSSYARPREKEVYTPLFVTSIRPEFILTAMKFLQQSLKDENTLKHKVDELRELTGGKIDQKLVKELSSAHAANELTAAIGISVSLLLAMADSSGKARAGFFKVNPKTGERTSGKPDLIELTLDGLFGNGYLPHPITLIKMWKKGNENGGVSNNHEYEFPGGNSQSSENGSSRTLRTPTTLDVEFPANDTAGGPVELKLAQGGFLLPQAKDIKKIGFPHSEKESKLPRYLSFLGFDFDQGDSNEVARLKICLIEALVKSHVETKRWTNEEDKTNYFIDVMTEIGKRLGKRISDFGDVGIEKREEGYKIPQDLVKLDYFLKALQSDTENDLEDSDINSVLQALYLLDENQYSTVVNELEKVTSLSFS